MDYKDFNRYGDEIRTAVKQERMSQVLLGLKGKERQWYEANREWLVKKWIFGKTRAAQDFKIFVTHKPGGFDRAPEIKEYQMQIFRTRWRERGSFPSLNPVAKYLLRNRQSTLR